MQYVKDLMLGVVQVKTWKQVLIIISGLLVYWALRNNPIEVQEYKDGKIEKVIKYR